MTTRPRDRTLVATRCLLLAAGLLAISIGATSLIAPKIIYTAYGIDIVTNVNLINELKASAGVLLIAGVLTLCGGFRTTFFNVSLSVAAAVYLAYGLSRLLSMVTDGIPDFALVLAAVVEIAVGGACLLRLLSTSLTRNRIA